MIARNFVLLAALFGFLGVAAGAFAAHGLAAHFAAHPGVEDTFRTAVQYQMYHALALLAAALLSGHISSRPVRWAGWLFTAGIVLFSGSLYILSLFEVRVMGAVAPLGGLAFLAGWACLGWAAWKSPRG
jgi:uncharacterized membrane protein YgdD (TMEM256/DUF423 family)